MLDHHDHANSDTLAAEPHAFAPVLQSDGGWYGTACAIAIGLVGLWALYGMAPFS